MNNSGNDWFFNMWQSNKTLGIYDRLQKGYVTQWDTLDEQGRYETWSWYFENCVGPDPLDYVTFCNTVDAIEKF